MKQAPAQVLSALSATVAYSAAAAKKRRRYLCCRLCCCCCCCCCFPFSRNSLRPSLLKMRNRVKLAFIASIWKQTTFTYGAVCISAYSLLSRTASSLLLSPPPPVAVAFALLLPTQPLLLRPLMLYSFSFCCCRHRCRHRHRCRCRCCCCYRCNSGCHPLPVAGKYLVTFDAEKIE